MKCRYACVKKNKEEGGKGEAVFVVLSAVMAEQNKKMMKHDKFFFTFEIFLIFFNVRTPAKSEK